MKLERKSAYPVVVGLVEKGPRPGIAGAVDQDIDPVEPVERCLRRRLAACGGSQTDRMPCRGRTEFGDFVRDLAQRIFRSREQKTITAFARKAQCYCAADSPASAGNDRDLAG